MEFLNLDQAMLCMRSLGVTRFYCKHLAENDNSKQQIYLGGSFDILRQLPFQSITAGDVADKRQNFKAKVDLFWINGSGQVCAAPGAQLILYPDYPEVRLSGFLKGAALAPSAYLRPIPRGSRLHNNARDGRVLLFGVANDRIYAYLAIAGSQIAATLMADFPRIGKGGPLTQVADGAIASTREQLLARLGAIVGRWHPSSRLSKAGVSMPYKARNGGGYTLEALLGVVPNGRSEPDFLGWEIKAISGRRVTLMTPEPNGGLYRADGAKAFVGRYGSVREDGAQYFTGVYKWGIQVKKSGLTMRLAGLNTLTGKINVSAGGIQLEDEDGQLAAQWAYAGLIEHWARKHAAAAYVRYESNASAHPEYRYNSPVMLGTNSTFDRFLHAIVVGKIVFDPGSKVDARGVVKARSQFRIAAQDLPSLYEEWAEVEL